MAVCACARPRIRQCVLLYNTQALLLARSHAGVGRKVRILTMTIWLKVADFFIE